MKKRVVTFGEIMMRLSPSGNSRFLQTSTFDINFGGAEANVAILLSYLGIDARYISKLPENHMGEMAISYLKNNGVDTTYISRGDDRIGVYYLEKGIGVRSSNVIYDRKDSAISKATISDFELEKIFEGADWFHFSGVTPALGSNMVEILKQVVSYCKNKNIKISVDLNFRSKLWSYKDFKNVMIDLIKDSYLCIGWIDFYRNDDDFVPVSFNSEEEELEYFSTRLSKMSEELNIKYIATTIRETVSTSKNTLRGFIFDGENFVHSKKYEFEIIDRVGSGDAFAAGLISELIQDKEINEAIEFAVCAGVYKHTINGDACIASYDEIKGISNGMVSGGVSR